MIELLKTIDRADNMSYSRTFEHLCCYMQIWHVIILMLLDCRKSLLGCLSSLCNAWNSESSRWHKARSSMNGSIISCLSWEAFPLLDAIYCRWSLILFLLVFHLLLFPQSLLCGCFYSFILKSSEIASELSYLSSLASLFSGNLRFAQGGTFIFSNIMWLFRWRNLMLLFSRELYKKLKLVKINSVYLLSTLFAIDF